MEHINATKTTHCQAARGTIRVVVVAAVFALTFIGCARAGLEVGDPLAVGTDHSAQDEALPQGPVAGSGSTPEDGARAANDASDANGSSNANDGTGGNDTLRAADEQVLAAHDEEESAPNRSAFVKVVAGTYSTCAIRHDGSVECWGMACSKPSPEDGSVKCWGRTCADGDHCHTFGIDAGSLPSHDIAGPPEGTFTEIDKDGGLESWCGLDREGTVTCWGSAHEGAPWPMATKFVDVATSGEKQCGIQFDGSLSCASANADAKLMSDDEYTSLSASATQMCALRADGTAECWGQGMTPPATPFTEVEVGGFHACGLRDDGNVMCWGAGTTNNACNEWDLECGQAMAPAGEFVQLTTGLAHSCGLRRDGTIECWGAGTNDNDCDATTAQSTHMQCGQAKPPQGHFVDVSAGAWHTCAIDTAARVVCWGLGQERGACGRVSGADALGTHCGQAAPPI